MAHLHLQPAIDSLVLGISPYSQDIGNMELTGRIGVALTCQKKEHNNFFFALTAQDRASAPFFCLPEDIEIEKLAIPTRRNDICWQCNPTERDTIVGEPHYQILLPEPWAIECAGDDPAQETRSHYNPRCNIGGGSRILFDLTSY